MRCDAMRCDTLYVVSKSVLYTRYSVKQCFLTRSPCFPRYAHVWRKIGSRDYLWMATKTVPNTEDERSIRRALQIFMDAKFDALRDSNRKELHEVQLTVAEAPWSVAE